ncbi:MAG: secreted proteinase [Planctomycetota bacterium]|nr:secreted proteinase [Planctomycetota bacterium]
MGTRDSKRVGFLTVAALVLSMAGSRALGDEVSFEKALPSLTWVLSPKGGNETSVGSGVLIDVRQGLVLTAYHVVEDRPKLLIFFPFHHADGRLETDPEFYTKHLEELAIVGEVIATQPSKDLALIQLPKVPATARATPLAATSPRTGQAVFAIGNSGTNDGVLWRYLDGRVRQVFRRKMVIDAKQQVDARVVESTVPTNGGDSGGPVLNADGELVAITSSSNTREVAVNYGIDLEEIRAIVGPTLARVERSEPAAPSITGPPPADDFIPPPPPGLSSFSRENRPGRAFVPSSVIDPVARVNDLHIDHDVVRDGRKGLVAHFNLEVMRTPSFYSMVYLKITDENGQQLRIPVPGSPGKGRDLEACNTLMTAEKPGDVVEMRLFIPYASIEQAISASTGRVKLKAVVNVPVGDSSYWQLEGGACVPFFYNSRPGAPM